MAPPEQNNNIAKEDGVASVSDSTTIQKLQWGWKDVLWISVILQTLLFLHFPYALYLCFFGCHNFFYTHLYGFCTSMMAGFATTAGLHRCWAHRSFKAKLPFRIMCMLFATTFYQFDIIYWCRIHRLHHKYAETDADPHNVNRGFFYSHIGWLMLKEEHPEVKKKWNDIDLSDLTNDAVLIFQRKHMVILTILLAIVLPPIFPMLWGESFWLSFNLYVVFRYALLVHIQFSVNSFAHMFGNKPHDKNVSGYDNGLMAFVSNGEGWHNYHHTFPYDYRASEFPWKFNVTTMFIDFFAWIGWVYDRKTISSEIISQRKNRTGEH